MEIGTLTRCTRRSTTGIARRTFTVPLPGRDPLHLGARTLVMGILNVTPDSFADGVVDVTIPSAVGEAVGGDVENAHEERPLPKVQRFPAGQGNRKGAARGDHQTIEGSGDRGIW